jgi:pSer/pThr/pTyr-binding forkhead associated (FHA) protein
MLQTARTHPQVQRALPWERGTMGRAAKSLQREDESLQRKDESLQREGESLQRKDESLQRGTESPERGRAGRGVLEAPAGAAVRVQNGFYEGLEIMVDRDWLVIGRGRSADMVIAEPTISRAHAAIGYDDRGFYVQDLGSTNGTLINGVRIDTQPLKNADEIQMGRLIVRVTLPA